MSGLNKPALVGQGSYLDIVKNISQNPISGAISSVYSGRTTELALFLSKVILDQGGKQVIVIKPNDISVMFNYNEAKIKQDKGSIGYAIQESSKYCEFTPLVYMNPHVLSELILKKLGDFSKDEVGSDLHFCNLIMIDSAYSNKTEILLLMYLWVEMFRTKKPVPRLLLLSDSEGYVDFLPDYPSVTIPTAYPQIKYALNQFVSANDPAKYQHFFSVISSYHLKNPLGPNSEDVWLVYLPDFRQVLACANHLADFDTEIIKIWSLDMNNKDTKEIKNPLSMGRRRIILSTEVGEGCFFSASIVFDSMTTTYMNKGKSQFQYISKNRAHQRGANATALVVRHIGSEFYDKTLINVTPREIKSNDLTKISLFMICNGLDYNEFFEKCGVPSTLIETNNKSMATLGVVQYNPEAKSFLPTDVGNFIYSTGLPIREGVLIRKWIEKSKSNAGLYQAVALITALDNPFIKNWDVKLEQFLLKNYKYNDVATHVMIYTYLVNELGSFAINDRKKFFGLCNGLGLDTKTVQGFFNLVSKRVGDLNMHDTNLLDQTGLVNLFNTFDSLMESVYHMSKFTHVNSFSYSRNGQVINWYRMARTIKDPMPKVLYNLHESFVKDNNERVLNAIKYVYVPR